MHQNKSSGTRLDVKVLKETDAEVEGDAEGRYVEGARDESDQEPAIFFFKKSSLSISFSNLKKFFFCVRLLICSKALACSSK